MKIAIDISPLRSGHRFRGVGAYTKKLTDWIVKLDKKNKYLLAEDKDKLNEADLIHFPYFHPFFLTLPLFPSKSIIVTIHDLIPLKFPQAYPPGIKGRLRFQLQKFALKKVGAVITDSQASKKDIVKFLGIKTDKIKVVYLAADEKFKSVADDQLLTSVKEKYSLPDQFVLYVGDVNYNKNIPGLVKACEIAALPLVIVGKQAASEEFDRNHPENKDLVWLQNEIKKQKLTTNNQPLVTTLGFVPDQDLTAIYNLAVVYCQPSLYEGFGLPVLEAASCGCPVVVADTSSLPEIAGEAALYVNPQKVESIAYGIYTLAKDKKLREELIKKGFANLKRFNWQKTARKTIEVYERVVSSF